MTRIAPLAAVLALALAGGPALAANAKVEAGVKAFAAVAADAEKLKTYCAMSKIMATATDETDSAKNEGIDKEIAAQMAKLGAEFSTAWDLGAELNPDSEDGKAMNAALEKLEDQCSR